MVNKRLVEIANRLGKYSPDLIPPSEDGADGSTAPELFSLEDRADFWRFSSINYRNNVYTVELKKELLDSRNSKTQDEWIDYSKQAKSRNDFHIADFPLYFAIKNFLYANKDDPAFKNKIKEVKEFMKKQMFDHWLMTSTRIAYNPKNEKDIVTHNYNMPDQYSLELDSFIGNDCLITDKKAVNVEDPLRALFDTNKSANKINQIYKWLTDVDAYLYRVNSIPNKRDERVAGFGAYSDWVDLDCGGDPEDSDSALGVRYAPQARAKK